MRSFGFAWKLALHCFLKWIEPRKEEQKKQANLHIAPANLTQSHCTQSILEQIHLPLKKKIQNTQVLKNRIYRQVFLALCVCDKCIDMYQSTGVNNDLRSQSDAVFYL